jgi:hypothetical protein
VAGPRAPFRPEEAARLKAVADRKVPLLLLVGDTENTGLEDLLKGFDVALERGFVVDPQLMFAPERGVVIVPVVNPRHEVLETLDNLGLLFPRPAPLKIVPPGSTDRPAAGVMATSLLRTSSKSWVEPDLTTQRFERNPTDPPGPVDIAVAVTDRPRPGDPRPPAHRLVVFASRNLAGNRYLQIAPTNLDLLMNAVNWLRGRPESVGPGPKSHFTQVLAPNDPVLRARLVLVPTVMAVLLIITLGVTTYLARRA